MNYLQALNKKLSEEIAWKINQVEQKNLVFLTGLTILSLLPILIIQNSWIADIASVLIIWLGLSINNFINPILREDSELLLALLSQLGDLATTAYGLQQGLTERNPFINTLISNFGIEGFTAVKAAILGLTIYFYRRKIENYRALIKIVFMLGLYLTAGNLMILWG